MEIDLKKLGFVSDNIKNDSRYDIVISGIIKNNQVTLSLNVTFDKIQGIINYTDLELNEIDFCNVSGTSYNNLMKDITKELNFIIKTNKHML